MSVYCFINVKEIFGLVLISISTLSLWTLLEPKHMYTWGMYVNIHFISFSMEFQSLTRLLLFA